MHILYLHQYFVPPDGTGSTRTYEMCKRLIEAGHKVTLITSSSHFPEHYQSNQWSETLNIRGIDLVVLNVAYSNNMSNFKRIIAFLKFSFGSLFEVAKIKNVDVVFPTSTPLTIAIPGIFAKIVHRCPMVFEVRDLWPELPVAMGALKNGLIIWLARTLEKLAYNQSERVIALSPGMADGVTRAGFPCNKIEIVPNSCDIDLFRISSKEGESFLVNNPHLANGPLIVYTGSVGRINGIEYLVRIAHEMFALRPEVRFLISGWGSELEKIKGEAIDLDVLNKNLWISPSIPKAEMPKLLSAATVATSFVVDLPELWNNSANKFFDALAAGRPIIINHEGWQADFIRKTGAGIVLPPSDPKTSARMISAFLNDKARMQQARSAAVEASETIFSRDILAAKVIKALEDVVAEQKR